MTSPAEATWTSVLGLSLDDPSAARPAFVLPGARATPESLAAAGCSTTSTVGVPAGQEEAFNGVFPSTFGYDPRAWDDGDVISASGEYLIRCASYAMECFSVITGPTAVRVSSSADRTALWADVELARHHGVFPELLTNPYVAVCDAWRLVPGGARGTSVLVGTGGIQDALDPAPYGGDDERPWIARFLAAVSMAGRLERRFGDAVAISGFGWRAHGGPSPTRPEAACSPAAAMVCRVGAQHLVACPVTQRLIGCSEETAGVVELVVECSADGAIPLVADRFGLSIAAAARTVDEVAERIGLERPGLEVAA